MNCTLILYINCVQVQKGSEAKLQYAKKVNLGLVDSRFSNDPNANSEAKLPYVIITYGHHDFNLN